MSTITFGLSTVEMGTIASDGAMGSELQVLGKTYQDTCKLTQDDPEVVEHFCEESDDPVLVMQKSGKTIVTFSVMDPSVEVLQKLMGGKAIKATEGTGDSWEASASSSDVEMSLRITPKDGYKLDIPRASVRAKISGDYSKRGIMLVNVTVVALTPKLASISKIKLYK